MAWHDDQYQRKLLDDREKWGTVLSLTAVAGTCVFLADHPHHRWLAFAPLLFGLLGSSYVLVVNSYYEQAEAFAEARAKTPSEAGGDDGRSVKKANWYSFSRQIGIMGRLNIIVPVFIGALATLALLYGFDPPAAQVPSEAINSPALQR